MLRPQPALLPCQQLHCVREERAAAESGRASGSPSAAGRASAPGRVRGGARGCAPPASRQLCPAPRAVRAVPPPPPPGPRRLPSQAGVWSGQGSPPGVWGIPVQPRGVQPAGGATCAASPARSTAWAGGGVGAPGRPEGRVPRLLRGSPNPVERPERARPSRTGPCAHPPRTPLLHKLF